MTSTTENFNAPAWATKAATYDAGTSDEWQQYSRTMPQRATMTELDDKDDYPAEFTLLSDTVTPRSQLALDGESLAFRSPDQAREFALALSAAADT